MSELTIRCEAIQTAVIAEVRTHGTWMKMIPEVMMQRPVEEIANPLATFATAGVKMRFPSHELASYRWPADWWQGVREAWLPAWWLRLHPVRYESIRVDEVFDVAVGRDDSRYIITGSNRQPQKK